MEDFVNNFHDRCGGVDYNPVCGNAALRLMQAPNDCPLRWCATPVSGVQCHSLINPPETGCQVNFKDKHAVEEIDESGEIPRTAAEKSDRLILIGDRRDTRLRIALIGQLTVAMNGVVAASLQFVADRSFTGTGNACN